MTTASSDESFFREYRDQAGRFIQEQEEEQKQKQKQNHQLSFNVSSFVRWGDKG